MGESSFTSSSRRHNGGDRIVRHVLHQEHRNHRKLGCISSNWRNCLSLSFTSSETDTCMDAHLVHQLCCLIASGEGAIASSKGAQHRPNISLLSTSHLSLLIRACRPRWELNLRDFLLLKLRRLPERISHIPRRCFVDTLPVSPSTVRDAD